jgi:hypothetical protein
MRIPLLLPAVVILLSPFDRPIAFGQERSLQLTASIAKQQLCSISENFDTLRLTLLLRYTNTSKEKLILYKGNRLFFQVFISRKGESAAPGTSVLRATHARYFDQEPEKIAAAAPGSAFTTLSPGGAYETRQVFSVVVARDGRSRFNVSLDAGEHTLNLATSTWYESKKLADELRERWRGRGFLWTDPVGSNTVPFTVGQGRPALKCN